MKAGTRTKRIAIAVPPNAQSLDVFGPLDVFIEATRQSGGAAVYDTHLVAIERERVIRTGGVSLVADGVGVHIPRGYIYFAMAFAAMVETINVLAKKRRARMKAASALPP